MEHNITFDNIWEKEEQQALAKRLRQEYPVWQRRRRAGRRAVASVAAPSPPATGPRKPDGY